MAENKNFSDKIQIENKKVQLLAVLFYSLFVMLLIEQIAYF